jgi:DNA repair exonuclease SbcCD ATPase subunit
MPVAKEKGIKDEIDALFQLPLTEFTAARNALAARLKKSGRADGAGEVKSLQKPPVSAWAVNQLYWRHRQVFDRLMTTGEQFRKAQAAQLSGKSADLRGPLEARRAALAEVSRLAAAVLQDAGSSPGPDTMRRIMTTVEALSSYGNADGGPQPGRLTADVDAPGFEVLAALVPTLVGKKPATGPTRVIPFHAKKERSSHKGTAEERERRAEEERKERLAAAKAAVREAERALKDAQKTAHDAEEKLKKAAAHAKETENARAEAEKVFEKAAAEADEARQKARRVAADAEEAAQGVEDAERALDKATRELNDLS